ncbi:uncharacterized protein LOC126407136 [Xyrichtys novacula]|uniref:Uncharacterized protein LOC126407136 n=1 Tax=Xyrichtys novacula TaxID=13765 RepID=A0AAV1G1B1_XYRNO|nr:uncharacterized protein LOC126407136 [Xyrichtys novacula]
MDSADPATAKQRPHRRRWRKSTRRLSRRFFCCSCLHGEDEEDPLQEQEEKINGGPQLPHLNQHGSGEKEVIQITVEDLGIVNGSFSLFEEDPLTSRSIIARSASSVSACPRALKKKRRVRPLSSLPVQPQSEFTVTSTSGEEDEEEEDDQLLFESGNESTPAGSLLTRPVINLIPPTPSDVADDDQFFDVYSEESVAHASGCDGDQEGGEDRMERNEAEEPPEEEEEEEEVTSSEKKMSEDSEAESAESLSDQIEDKRETEPAKEDQKEKTKSRFLCGSFQVAALPEFPQKRSYNAGINLLSFTEQNLDDLTNRDVSCADMLRADLCPLPNTANMDTFTHQRRLITRSCSLEDKLTRSATFHALTQTADHKEEGDSPRERRITVASFMPQSSDQNGNFPEKDTDKQDAKPLREMNTEEVCQWFSSIGLQKCLPFIQEAKLCGPDVASVDLATLEILHITTLEDRELLLSAIYNELHPPNTISRRLDSLLESLGPENVEAFTATLVSMSKSKSSPHVSCLSRNRRSLKLRNNNSAQRNSQLIEITINASERIVHLRTPKETTVGKVMDSCIKMLNMSEDKSLFVLKEKEDSAEDLPSDQQIGSLLTSTSENTQLELHLCKKEKSSTAVQDNPEVKGSNENSSVNKNVTVSQPAKEERIRELNQQVDSLQNVILQVQELHHGLVAFCSELKSMDGDVSVERLGSAELKERLELVKNRLMDKKQSLQTLRDNMNNSAAHKKKQLDVRLLEKMKLNCQVFKEEISIVHLTRQVAHLQNALQESYVTEKVRKKSLAVGSLSQLVSPQSPAMLLVVQENQNPDGRYGFTCRSREGGGLAVVKVDDSHLCVDDRLVEVNGVPVINSTTEELTDILLQGPSAQIVVLRQPPPSLTFQQHPLLLIDPDPLQPIWTDNSVVPMETPPQRKVMAI